MVPDRIGDWRIERQLGSGGMATVFRAHAVDDADLLAAIKICDVAWHPEAIARFRSEAALLQSVEHPGVVRVYDARFDAQPPYLVMELVEGEELGHLIGRLGALPVRGALLIAMAIADVLAHLHGRGIYHRDLKPANVIVRPDHSIKLVDFGIAREEGRAHLTMSNHRVGTAAYAPPEWVRPDVLKPWHWDLYALGVVLYEILTGTERFPATDSASAMQHAVKVMAEKAQLEHLDPGEDIPDEVRALVRALTARAPEARPEAARVVHHQLKTMLRDPGIATSPGRSGRLSSEDFEDSEDTWLASQDSRPVAQLPASAASWRRPLLIAGAVAAVLAVGLGVVAIGVVVLAAALTVLP